MAIVQSIVRVSSGDTIKAYGALDLLKVPLLKASGRQPTWVPDAALVEG